MFYVYYFIIRQNIRCDDDKITQISIPEVEDSES